MSKKFSLLTEYSEHELKEIILQSIGEVLEKTVDKIHKTGDVKIHSSQQMISRRELCEKLKLSLPTVAKLHKTGKLKAIIVGGVYRYSQKNITDFMEGGN